MELNGSIVKRSIQAVHPMVPAYLGTEFLLCLQTTFIRFTNQTEGSLLMLAFCRATQHVESIFDFALNGEDFLAYYLFIGCR